MAKKYVCKERATKHVRVPIPCAECSRHSRSRKCYDNHKRSTIQKRSVCERKRCCANCVWLVTHGNHECNKRFCGNCKQNRDVDHLYYMRPLKDVLPTAGDKVIYVFYDFETTKNTRYAEKATLHVPDNVCVQTYCAHCVDVEEEDCMRCGKRKHSFWDDPFGYILTGLSEPRPSASKIVAIAYNAKTFDLHFILNRAIVLKWKPELIMNGL